jgi:hypothetical protein
MKTLRVLTVVFSISTVGVLVSLGMSIYTSVSAYRERNRPLPPRAVPVPALSSEDPQAAATS